MEREVEGVGQFYGELLSLLEIGNVSEKNDTFAHKSGRVQRNPDGVTNPKISNKIFNGPTGVNFIKL